MKGDLVASLALALFVPLGTALALGAVIRSSPEAPPSAYAATVRVNEAFIEMDAALSLDAPVVDLGVPFRTQKDGDRFQGSNCGPAALAMVLGAFGIDRANADLRVLTHTYQGTVGRRGGTALEHMATVGRDFGLEPLGLYTGERFSEWSIDRVRAAVLAGQPVIALVKYRLLPGHEGSGVRFDHYVVISGLDSDSFLYHDPAYAAPEEGGARWIEAVDLDRAMAAASISRQGVAFGPGRHVSLIAAIP